MSNIEIVRKRLGPVTAYKYAVSKGFTGTEEEFAELMASYATVAEEAEAAKDDAIIAKTAAEEAQAAAEAAAEQAEGAIEVDYTLSVKGRAADSETVGEKFNAITVTYHPENYAENIDASSLVVASSTLIGNVAATDNASGGIDVVNNAGVNGLIGFPLSDLPYNTDKVIDLIVNLDNAKAPVAVSLRRGVSSGSSGTVIKSFDEDNENYTTVVDCGDYNYSTAGELFIGLDLRYNQTTPVTIKIKAIEQGSRNETVLDIAKIENLSLDNFSTPLQETITTAVNSSASAESKVTDITISHVPTEYAIISASDLVEGAAGLIGKVSATDNPNGGIDIVNNAGVNGKIGFQLTGLPYGEDIGLIFTVKVSGGKTPISVDLRRAMASGSSGTLYVQLALESEDTYVYSWQHFRDYNYGVGGYLFLGFDLRYNQTTPVNIQLSVKKIGDTEKTVIKNSALSNIGFNNLSDELSGAISVVSGEKPTEYGGKQIATFNKGVAIGDSLTAGVFNYNEGGTQQWATIHAFSYPAKLKQMTGIEFVNLGNGGYTSDQWWTAHQNDDLSGNQFAIVQLGVNDAIQYSGWSQTSVTAFTNIINKLLTENNGIFVFVATIIPATSYQGTSYNAVSEGIRTLVESINNDHVILLDMAEYGNTADEVGYNNGHLSALGYERLALDYIAYISHVIARNPTLFRNIQFIGTNLSYS